MVVINARHFQTYKLTSLRVHHKMYSIHYLSLLAASCMYNTIQIPIICTQQQMSTTTLFFVYKYLQFLLFSIQSHNITCVTLLYIHHLGLSHMESTGIYIPTNIWKFKNLTLKFWVPLRSPYCVIRSSSMSALLRGYVFYSTICCSCWFFPSVDWIWWLYTLLSTFLILKQKLPKYKIPDRPFFLVFSENLTARSV
jgi:hypothetical protein